MRLLRPRLVVLCSCLLAIPALRGQVVIQVSGGGAALANAVAAAPSGATLVVAFASYSGFSVVDKDLTIVAPARAIVTGPIDATAGTVPRTLQLANLDVTQAPGGPPYGYVAGSVTALDNLHMLDCTCQALRVGIVTPTPTVHCWLERCTVSGDYPANMIYADTALVDCIVRGAPSFSGVFGWQSQRGLWMTGSLRAERTQFESSSGAPGSAVALEAWGPTTLANCTLTLGSPGPLVLWSPVPVTTWATTIAGASSSTTTRLLATAQWSQRNWTVGGTSQLTIREAPNTIAVLVVSLGLQPWMTSFAAERLWVGATPNWGIWSVGVTDAQGDYATTAAIPNTPALLYGAAWLAGVFVDPLPVRTSLPIGGTIL